MYFRSNNFQLEDNEKESFQTIITGIDDNVKLCKTSNGSCVSFGREAFTINSKTGNKRKQAIFDDKITAMSRCGDFIVLGSENGTISVTGPIASAIRTYNENEARVSDIKSIGPNKFAASSFDLTVKIYDISLSESVYTINDHKDYITCLEVGNGMLFTGSYDNTINGYSLDTYQKLFHYRAKLPISRISYIEEGKLAFSSGNEVFIIDMDQPDEVHTASIHNKEITQMKYYEGRLYTSSLDGTLKVMTRALKIITRLNLLCGILDFDVYQDKPIFALEDGRVIGKGEEPAVETATKVIDRRGPLEDVYDVEIITHMIQKYDNYEKMMKKNEFKKALVTAFIEKDTQKIFAVLTYFKYNQLIRRACFGLSKEELKIVLDGIADCLNIRELLNTLLDTINIILNLHEHEIVQDMALLKKLHDLEAVVAEEALFQEELIRTISFLECFVDN